MNETVGFIGLGIMGRGMAHNVVAASATVGLMGREGAILRKTILPMLYYVVVVGLLGVLAIYVLGVTDPLLAVP